MDSLLIRPAVFLWRFLLELFFQRICLHELCTVHYALMGPPPVSGPRYASICWLFMHIWKQWPIALSYMMLCSASDGRGAQRSCVAPLKGCAAYFEQE